jgi:hypothetical protein
MRIYEGSPRQDFEEVFRSIGAFLDQRGMREVLLAEAPDGFIVQGLVTAGAGSATWSDSMGSIVKETLTFLDDDIARFMDEAVARRQAVDQAGPGPVAEPPSSAGSGGTAGYYESAFRVLGRYMDEQRPRDVFLFEQDGAFVVRLLQGGQSGSRHTLAEFTREDIAELIARGPALRHHEPTPGAAAASGI